MSQAVARSTPAPMQPPWIAAITGGRACSTALNAVLQPVMWRSRASAARPGSSLGGNWLGGIMEVEAGGEMAAAAREQDRAHRRVGAERPEGLADRGEQVALSMALNLPSRASSTWATPPSRPIAILSLSIVRPLPLETSSMTPLYRERPARPLPHGPGDSPALGAPRRVQPHRHQIWLRHRPLRRLHRPCRRPGGAELPGADRATSRAASSPPSRRCRATARIRSSRPGSPRACRNAAICQSRG